MSLLKQTFNHFLDDDCMTLAASLAYYTIFALPPLCYLLLTIVTFGLSLGYETSEAEQRARELIKSQAGDLVGNQAAEDEIAVILQRNQQQGGVWWKSLLSLGGIVIGATGVVVAIQVALNRIWKVQLDPERGALWDVLVKRILSLAMILGLGFLLVVSMFVSTVLTALGSQVGEWIGLQQIVVSTVNYAVTLLVTLIVFAALLKFMPDAKIAWRDALLGALVTCLLFVLGRILMRIYFSFSDPGVQLGSAAASLVVLLVWVYYSALIFLAGAEFTQAWASQYGRGIRPEPGAVRFSKQVTR